MSRIPRPKCASVAKAQSEHAGFEAREAERRRKEDLEREARRVAKESEAMFGGVSFVTVKAVVEEKRKEEEKGGRGEVKKEERGDVRKEEGRRGEGKEREAPNEAAATFWPLGRPSTPTVKVAAAVAMVKKAGGGGNEGGGVRKEEGERSASKEMPAGPSPVVKRSAGASIKVSASVKKKSGVEGRTAAAKMGGEAAFKPAPLPSVAFLAPSALPSLADWRSGARTASPPLRPSKISRRKEEDEEEDEEEDLEVDDDDDHDDFIDNLPDPRRKKRRPESDHAMDDMWAQLRAITGYNPNSAKYKERDRFSISESSHQDLSREERQSRAFARMEEAEEEERERKRLLEKKRKLTQWRSKNGFSSDSSDPGDTDDSH